MQADPAVPKGERGDLDHLSEETTKLNFKPPRGDLENSGGDVGPIFTDWKPPPGRST